MAGGARLVVALLAGLMLTSYLPSSHADSSQSESQLELGHNEISELYLIGEELNLSPYLFNRGSQITIDNDKSCDYIVKIMDEDGNVILDTTYRCTNHLENIVLLGHEAFELSHYSWDFKNWDGTSVNPGKYTLEIKHSEVMVSKTLTFEYYDNSPISSDLELITEVILLNSTSEIVDDYLIQLTLYNPTSNIIELPSDYCTLVIEYRTIRQSLSDCDIYHTKLTPFENTLVGSFIINREALNMGENNVEILSLIHI